MHREEIARRGFSRNLYQAASGHRPKMGNTDLFHVLRATRSRWVIRRLSCCVLAFVPVSDENRTSLCMVWAINMYLSSIEVPWRCVIRYVLEYDPGRLSR